MPSLAEKMKKGDTDAYESFIPQHSLLIGKTLKKVMGGFEKKVIIGHIHNGSLEFGTRLKVTPRTIFRKGMYIKIFGEWEDICIFTTKFGLP